MFLERLVSNMTNFPLSPRSPDYTIFYALLCYAEIPVFPTNSKMNWTTKTKQQTVFRNNLPNQCSKMVKILSNWVEYVIGGYREVIACMHVISVHQFVTLVSVIFNWAIFQFAFFLTTLQYSYQVMNIILY